MSDSIEEWRAVAGFEGAYEVSSHGRARSLLSMKIMAGNSARYKQINLYNRALAHLPLSKRYTCRSVHRLVAEAFIGPRPPFAEVRHLDGNRRNNRVENLKYGTRAENLSDDVAHGKRRGERNGRSVLTGREAGIIKALLNMIPTINRSALARAFGVSRTVISHIEKGRQWRHVTPLDLSAPA